MSFIVFHGLVHVLKLEVVSNLILSYSQLRVFILSVPESAFLDVDGVTGALPLKTEAQKLRTPASFLSRVVRSPFCFWKGPTLAQSFSCLQCIYRSPSCYP